VEGLKPAMIGLPTLFTLAGLNLKRHSADVGGKGRLQRVGARLIDVGGGVEECSKKSCRKYAKSYETGTEEATGCRGGRR
jgi:hypothetical protein